jgi:hypothetical protein
MMFQLSLSHSRKVRIWVDELPEDVFIGAAGFVERRFPSNEPLAFRRKISIELFIPRGGRFDYGLIGGELLPNDADEFIVTVCHSARHPHPLADSLAGALDDVLVGFPRDYADAVADGIAMADSDHASLPASNLRVCHGAYGKLGSSVFFFRLLGKTFYRMITAPAIPSEDKDMAEFFVNLLEGK